MVALGVAASSNDNNATLFVAAEAVRISAFDKGHDMLLTLDSELRRWRMRNGVAGTESTQTSQYYLAFDAGS